MASRDSFEFDVTINAEAAARRFNDLWTDAAAGSRTAREEVNKIFGREIKQKVVIDWVTDESGLKKPIASVKEFGDAISDVERKQSQLNKTQQGSVTSLRQQVNEAKQVRDQITKYGQSIDGIASKVRTINPEWAAQNQKLEQLNRQLQIASASSFFEKVRAEFNLGGLVEASRALNGLVNTFQSLSIIIGQVQQPINALLTSLNDIQQIELLFKGIGGTQESVNQVFSDSADIALKYGVNIKTVRDAYSQLTPVVQNSGGSISDVSNIVNALSSRFVTFGLSAEKSRRVMNGIIQAFGKGKLMAEELTQQISEADPAFKTDLANAIGVSVQKLNEMVKAGEITSDVLIQVLPQLAKTSKFFESLGSSATVAAQGLLAGNKTVEQVRNTIATLNQLNLEAVANLFKPLLGSFLAVQAAITDFVTDIRKLEAFKFATNVINGTAVALATLFTALTKIISTIAQILDPIFKVVNAFDQFVEGLLGFSPVIILVSGLILGTLVKSILSFVTNAIPKAIQAFANFGGSLGGLSRGVIPAFGSIITKVFGGVATQVVQTSNRVVTEMAKIGASFQKTAAIAKQAKISPNVDFVAMEAARKAASAGPGVPTAGAATSISYLPKPEQIKALRDQLDGLQKGYIGIGAVARQAFADTSSGAISAGRAVVTAFSGLGVSIGNAASGIRNSFVGAFGAITQAIASPRTAFIGFVDSALNKGVQLEAGFNKINRAGGSLGMSVLSGTKAALGGLIALLAPLAAEAAAFAAVGLAIESYTSVMSRADAINKATRTSVEELNAALAAQNMQATQTGTGWDASVKNVGLLQAGLDRFRNALGLTTAEEAQYNQATIAANDGAMQRIMQLDQLGAALQREREAGNGSVESLAKQKQISDAMTTSINSRLAAINADIAKENALAAVSGNVNAAKQNLINSLKSEKQALEAILTQYGLTTTAMNANAEAAKSLASEVQKIGEAQIKSLEVTKGQESQRFEGQKEAINQIKQASTDRYNAEKQGIERSKASAQAAHQAAKAQIAEAREASNSYYDGLKRQIESVRAAEASVAAERIRGLQKATPAEQELQDLRERELRSQAAKGGQEGLEARAQLERIEANAKIAQIQEEERKKEEEAKMKIKAIEEEKAAKEKEFKAQERSEDLAHQQQMAQLAADERDLEQSYKEEQRRLEEESSKISKEAKEAERAIDEEIASLRENMKQATEDAATAAGEFTGRLQDGETAAKAIETRMAAIKKLADSIRLPAIPGLFTGGPVSGGSSYTVNEMGQEMFLSRSGKLSYINAPAWGEWRAPGAGTVIPAHIAANIDVPRRGAKISQSAASMARNIPSNVHGTRKMINLLNEAVRAANNNNSNSAMALGQAAQAAQLGKLTHAINELTDKDWNVRVNVRSSNDAVNYARIVNRRI